jgi:hypothetical protein
MKGARSRMGYTKDVRMDAPAVMDLDMRAASYEMLVLRHLALR